MPATSAMGSALLGVRGWAATLQNVEDKNKLPVHGKVKTGEEK